ncbi:zinc ribbon domain-containing protein [Ktedonospora formicarum]|uniref:zinc ribbon domain-containing protein n=1 Tax=Ktedonospora formicarum TaxID=2778364 RepID=UPI003B75B68A
MQAKGAHSAKRHPRQLSGKLFRQRKDHDHVLSKHIVQNAAPGSTIVLESLTHIRSRARMRKGEGLCRLHSWSFAQFHAFLSYKAQEKGIAVVKVDPRHTSQTCSRCEHLARHNCRSQSLFLCRVCGFSLNAAHNIAEKHLAHLDIPLASGSLSDGLSSHASA